MMTQKKRGGEKKEPETGKHTEIKGGVDKRSRVLFLCFCKKVQQRGALRFVLSFMFTSLGAFTWDFFFSSFFGFQQLSASVWVLSRWRTSPGCFFFYRFLESMWRGEAGLAPALALGRLEAKWPPARGFNSSNIQRLGL